MFLFKRLWTKERRWTKRPTAPQATRSRLHIAPEKRSPALKIPSTALVNWSNIACKRLFLAHILLSLPHSRQNPCVHLSAWCILIPFAYTSTVNSLHGHLATTPSVPQRWSNIHFLDVLERSSISKTFAKSSATFPFFPSFSLTLNKLGFQETFHQGAKLENYQKYNVLNNYVSLKCWFPNKGPTKWMERVFLSFASISLLFASSYGRCLHTCKRSTRATEWVLYMHHWVPLFYTLR